MSKLTLEEAERLLREENLLVAITEKATAAKANRQLRLALSGFIQANPVLAGAIRVVWDNYDPPTISQPAEVVTAAPV